MRKKGSRRWKADRQYEKNKFTTLVEAAKLASSEGASAIVHKGGLRPAVLDKLEKRKFIPSYSYKTLNWTITWTSETSFLSK